HYWRLRVGARQRANVMTLLAHAPRHIASPARELSVRTYAGPELAGRLPALTAFATAGARVPLSRHPDWLKVLREGLGHEPYALEAVRGGRTVGVMALACVRSLLFGRYLVSLPYLNSGGAYAEDGPAAAALTDRALEPADRLRVPYLDLRPETVCGRAATVPRSIGAVRRPRRRPAGGGGAAAARPARDRSAQRQFAQIVQPALCQHAALLAPAGAGGATRSGGV